MTENFEKVENIFDENDIVKTTVGELIQLVNLCVKLDRIEEPEHVDYAKHVMKYLQKINNENEKLEQ